MNGHMPTRSRLRGDDGAVIVEAALVMPILLFLLLGFLDFGMAIFRQSQVSSAARDGARVGIIDYRQADQVGSADWNSIDQAVRQRLAGSRIDQVTVTCENAAGTAKSCASAAPDTDFLRVAVRWTYRPVSFVGALISNRTFTSTSRMSIIGGPLSSGSSPPPPVTTPQIVAPATAALSTAITVSGSGFSSGATVTITFDGAALGTATVAGDGTFSFPTTVPATAPSGTSTIAASVGGTQLATTTIAITGSPVPGTCQVASATVTPNPVGRKGNGQLKSALLFSVVTNGGSCGSLTVYYQINNASGTTANLTGTSPNYTATVGASQHSTWTIGNKTFQVRSNGTVIFSGAFRVG